VGDRLFSRELFGKEVETINGRTVGILEDIVIDTDDGSIRYLLISTAGNVAEGSHKVDEKGRIVVETDRIRVKDDKLIIN
jgi:sporulation protein YlmC with PRC-barrel domain